MRATGIGVEIEEFQAGLACVAAPVRDTTGAVQAAVSVSVTPDDFARRRGGLEGWVRTGAEWATRALTQQDDAPDTRRQP